MWHELTRDGVRLACLDYGGEGDPVILLHGLAGHAGEWAQTTSWLTRSHRVLAPDVRGHGRSERRPNDVSREAHVADVVAWCDYFGASSTCLVGQSLGGHTAFLVAARHPGLVSRLVVAEAHASPVDGPASTGAIEWLRSWPVPFASRADAIAFFGGEPAWAAAWADGLEEGEGGLLPAFDLDVLAATLSAAADSYWDDWTSVACPTLIVTAADGDAAAAAPTMVAANGHATHTRIREAGHDLHLDNPAKWRAAVEPFLA